MLVLYTEADLKTENLFVQIIPHRTYKKFVSTDIKFCNQTQLL